MRYLVATDGSTQSDDAVRYATEHAIAFDAVLEIVHSLTPETELVEGEVVVPGEEAAFQQGRRILGQATGIAEDVAADRGAELAVETELLTGRPAAAICEYAVETGADAIYVGHRGLSTERERVVGSVAKTIVDRADVPVTIIR